VARSVVLIVMGLVFWAVSALLPIPEPFKNAVLAVVVLIAAVWILSIAGMGFGPHWHR
jgi:hypothetical protein